MVTTPEDSPKVGRMMHCHDMPIQSISCLSRHVENLIRLQRPARSEGRAAAVGDSYLQHGVREVRFDRLNSYGLRAIP
jgi:hypothetical protein